MKSYILFAISCLLSMTYAIGQPTNINISLDVSFDGEPYMAVNPANPQNIIIAWMGVTINPVRISIKTKSSFDGGVTWGNYFVQPHFSYTWGSADVSMAFKNDGTVYLSYIDFTQANDSGGIYITHSNDGGVIWSSPTQVWNGNTEDVGKYPIDRPWLVIDNSSSANYGTLYMTTKPAYWIPPPNHPYLKFSTDSGQTWSPYRYIDTVGSLVGQVIVQPMAAPSVSASGALCIAYPSYDVSQSVYAKYFFAKSYSKGSTFTYTDLLVNPTPVVDTDYKTGYHLAANPNDSNQFCFAYIGNQNGDPDVFVNTTNDGGMTWSSAIRVNDDAIGNGKAQDMPWANYGSDGVLCITWRDRRNGTDTGFFQPSDTYCAISHDNGATFLPNIRLSSVTAAFDSVLLDKGNDFMSCQLVHDSINAAWGDVRTGKLNIFFAKTSDSTGQNTGIIEVASEAIPNIEIFPNPATDKVFVTNYLLNGSGIKMIIYDETGKEIFHKNSILPQEIIDCSKWATGIYFVKVMNGEGSGITRKFVKEL